MAIAAACFGCDARVATSPTPEGTALPASGDPGAWRDADLMVVVTANDLDALVGIDVASRTLTPPTPIDRNEAKPHMDGGMVSVPPLSVVLSDPARPNPLLWTVASGNDTVVIRELDRGTGEVRPVAGPVRGVLPFLYQGQLAWASAPRDGLPRVLLSDGTDLNVPRVPLFVVAGPGAGRITAVVELGNFEAGERNERIVVIDVGTETTAFLPTERLHYGGLWADDSILAASVYSRIVPTLEDPQNGEPDNRVLTWSSDLGEGAALRTNPYPEPLAGGNGIMAVVTSNFDHPRVEVHALDSTDPAQLFELPEATFVTAMRVVGTTLVVLASRSVTFVDLTAGITDTVDLGGTTGTLWVGR